MNSTSIMEGGGSWSCVGWKFLSQLPLKSGTRAPSPISSLEMCMSNHCRIRIADTSFEILNGYLNMHAHLGVRGSNIWRGALGVSAPACSYSVIHGLGGYDSQFKMWRYLDARASLSLRFGRFSRDISRCESVCTLLHCPNQYKCCFNAYSAGSYCMVCCSCRHIKYIAVLPDIKGLCAGVFRIRQIRWSVLCML